MKAIETRKQIHSKDLNILVPLGKNLMFILFVCFLNSGCNKDDSKDSPTPDNTTQVVPDKYYIKYIVSSSTIYSGGKLNQTMTTEKNQNLTTVINQNTKSETIIGPVSKGFKASLTVVAAGSTQDKLKLYTEIHISKNNDPFALKSIDGTDTPRNKVELSYVIDY